MLRESRNIYYVSKSFRIGDPMKLLSHKEFQFLLKPSNFPPGYKRVLKSRINKKVQDIEKTLRFIDKHRTSMMTLNQLEKHNFIKRYYLWLDILTEAFRMKDEDRSEKSEYW